MEFEVLLFLLVFAVPGAVFLKSWDFFGHKYNRNGLSLIGFGMLLSSLIYILLSIIQVIDLSTLFTVDGNISITQIIDTTNIIFFLILIISMALIASCLSFFFHSNKVQNLCSFFLGKTTIDSSWADIARNTTNEWIRIITKSNYEIQGIVFKISDEYKDGFIAIADPEIFNQETNKWVSNEYRTLFIKLSDIEIYQSTMPNIKEGKK